MTAKALVLLVSVAVVMALGLLVLGCGGSHHSNNTPLATPPAALTFVTGAALPNGQVGQPYSQQLRVTGGALPYSFGIGGTALPSGMIVSGSGLVQGSPTLAGNYTFDIVATDTGSARVARQFSLTIDP